MPDKHELTKNEKDAVTRGLTEFLSATPKLLEFKASGTSSEPVVVCGVADLGTFFYGELSHKNGEPYFEVKRAGDAMTTAPRWNDDLSRLCTR